jgi:hypothetical protein
MTFNLPNLREAKPAAMSKAPSESTHQPSRSSTSTRQSDSSFMDEKEAHVTWAEVKGNNSKAKTSKLSRIVQGQYNTFRAAYQY